MAATKTIIIRGPKNIHGPAFQGFPELQPPHFIELALAASAERGFDAVDLTGGLQAAARDELLYFRDDHHWNARGNAVVAALLEDALNGRR